MVRRTQQQRVDDQLEEEEEGDPVLRTHRPRGAHSRRRQEHRHEPECAIVATAARRSDCAPEPPRRAPARRTRPPPCRAWRGRSVIEADGRGAGAAAAPRGVYVDLGRAAQEERHRLIRLARRAPPQATGTPGYSAGASWPVGSLLVPASSWLFLGAALSRVASVAATVVLARVLVPRDLGRLTLLQTAVTLLAGLSGSGLVLGVTRQVAETRLKDAARAGRFCWGRVAADGGLVSGRITGVYLLFGDTFCSAVLRDSSLVAFVPASATVVGVTAVNASLQSALTGLEAFRHHRRGQAGLALATAVGLVVGAKADGINGALVGTGIGQLIVAAPAAGMLHRLATREAIRSVPVSPCRGAAAVRASGSRRSLRFSR